MSVKIKKKVSQDKKQQDSNARVAKFRQGKRLVVRRACADLERRARLEKNAIDWLKYYFPNSYPLPFGEVHEKIIDYTLQAVKRGGKFSLAAPRGTGKTTILFGLLLFIQWTMDKKFALYVPWSSADKKKAIKFWKTALTYNKRLADDYPEYCDPFRKAKGASMLLQFLMWEDTLDLCSAQIENTNGSIIYPSGLGLIGTSTINGNPRGMNYTLEDGTVLRPDFALIDDPQDKDTANSPASTQKVIGVIEEDLLGTEGPDVALTVVAIGTVLGNADVMTYLLNSKEYKSYRVPQIISFPKNMNTWKEWNEIRLDELEGDNDDEGYAFPESLEFYKKNQVALMEDFEVSWLHRFKKKLGQPDAFYAAMQDYFSMGETAFMKERQNAPLNQGSTIYELTKSIILSRTSMRKALIVSNDYKIVVAGTDINHYGLHTVICGFRADHSAEVVGYFRLDNGGDPLVPENATEQLVQKLILKGLFDCGNYLKGLAIHNVKGERKNINCWLIDGGYEMRTVAGYVKGEGRMCGIPLQVIRGQAEKKFKIPPKSKWLMPPKFMCYLNESQYGRWIAANVDYWKETMQRAWLDMIGSPGSINLPKGNHIEFAEHIIRERLIDKVVTSTVTVRIFAEMPGWHDYSDALTYCYVAAAWLGIVPFEDANAAIWQEQKRKKRQPSITGIGR